MAKAHLIAVHATKVWFCTLVKLDEWSDELTKEEKETSARQGNHNSTLQIAQHRR